MSPSIPANMTMCDRIKVGLRPSIQKRNLFQLNLTTSQQKCPSDTHLMTQTDRISVGFKYTVDTWDVFSSTYVDTHVFPAPVPRSQEGCVYYYDTDDDVMLPTLCATVNVTYRRKKSPRTKESKLVFLNIYLSTSNEKVERGRNTIASKSSK